MTEDLITERRTDAGEFVEQSEFLELREVNVARGERVVLHDVNLHLRAGEHVAILGPNGCGKSTLILAMTCQIYPIVGPDMVVRIFGRERWDRPSCAGTSGWWARSCRGSEPPLPRDSMR